MTDSGSRIEICFSFSRCGGYDGCSEREQRGWVRVFKQGEMAGEPVEGGDLAEARAHLRGADGVLGRLIEARPDFDPVAWLAELPPMDVFGALLFQVVGQQLSVAATRRILRHIQDRFEGRLPTAAEWLGADPADLRGAGLSRRKVETMRILAKEFVDHELSQELLESLSDAEIEARLTAIPGIGPWTVQGMLILALGRQDVVLPGDLALRKSIQRVYQLDHLPSQAEVVEMAERWRPYRTLATAYLYQAAFDRAGRTVPG
jgi:DNA-3-methyladenine glycosylase II